MPRSRPVRRGWPTLAVLAALALAASAAYTVRPGDTLSEIAARHGTTVRALADANGLADPNRIQAGQQLALPGGGAGGTTAGGQGATVGQGATHTVQPGETLSGIAARHGTATRALADANGLADPNRVRAGSTLAIPGGGRPAAAPRAPASTAAVEALIERISREHGWNPAFVKAVAWQESGWNNDVVSHAGAIGIMQVLPETGQRVSRTYGRTLDLHDPADNIRAGVLFLDELYVLTGGDVELTLAGYFQGLANVRRNGLYTATERYTDNVLALRERYR